MLAHTIRRIAPAIALTLAAALSVTRGGTAAAIPNDERTIAHVLDRLGYGPRPGDIERVKQMGLAAYIDRQLYPERISDESTSARLADLRTLEMTSVQIAREYFIPAQIARRDARRADASRPENERMTPPERPQGPPPEEVRRQREVMQQLTEQKIIRAVYSERQLHEVLVDFWFNHFNVFAGKGVDRILLTEYEREAIRPHVLGRFRDLLEATAKSPAMLFYLDNWLSADPNGPHPLPGQRRNRFGPTRPPNVQNPMKRGLNENYARELMELHTLGVDGGYTQRDIVEVARAFTGWTMERPGPQMDRMGPRIARARLGGGDGLFFFDPRIHDQGEKVVLGHKIKAGGGMEDGERVLDILAAHPSTATFIATKLARRFVSDDPPRALVNRAAGRFRETKGDLREVVRTIVTAPEFLASTAYRAKVKSPFEFVVSALRTTAADVADATPVAQALQQLGQPLYMCQPPTGYSDKSDAWVNSGALINRMNFAVALANGRLRGIAMDSVTAFGPDPAPPDLERTREKTTASWLRNDISESTRAALGRATTVAHLTALAIGSPEFQRR